MTENSWPQAGGGLPQCPLCENTSFQEGFIDDKANGTVRWILGELDVGVFGATRKAFKDSMYLRAVRCNRCGRLELFAVP